MHETTREKRKSEGRWLNVADRDLKVFREWKGRWWMDDRMRWGRTNDEDFRDDGTSLRKTT